MSEAYIINSNSPRSDPCGSDIINHCSWCSYSTLQYCLVPFMKEALKLIQCHSCHVVASVQTLNKNVVVDDIEFCIKIK